MGVEQFFFKKFSINFTETKNKSSASLIPSPPFVERTFFATTRIVQPTGVSFPSLFLCIFAVLTVLFLISAPDKV